MTLRGVVFTSALAVVVAAPALANDKYPALSWTLPKTVLDVSITYQYASCKKGKNGKDEITFSVLPVVAQRGIPDPVPGWRHEETEGLKTIWSDVDLAVSTFPTTHILSSVTSHATGEGAAVASNILAGVTGFAKLAAATIPSTTVGKITKNPIPGGESGSTKADGANQPASDKASDQSKPDSNACADDPGKHLKELKQDLLKKQADVNGATPDALKDATTALQKAQSAVDVEKARLSFTVKTSINPGYTDKNKPPLDFDHLPALPPELVGKDGQGHSAPSAGPLDQNGLVADIQIGEGNPVPNVDWITNWAGSVPLEVTIYLDFDHAIRSHAVQGSTETVVHDHEQAITYRDPALIPVEVYVGKQSANGSTLLLNALVPFAQYGEEEVIPLSTESLKEGNWGVTFNELGEQTKVTYIGKSIMEKATSFMTQAGTAASGVATELRGANGNEATSLQNQADVIYQSHRLEMCLQNPASCPSK